MAQGKKMAPQKRGPERRGPHQDPAGRGKSGGVGWGGLLVAALGFSFVGYVWNLGGMATWLDGWFRGFDHAAHGHDAGVQRVFLAALPVIGALLVLALLSLFLFAGRGGEDGGHKRKSRRKRKTGVAVQASQVGLPPRGAKGESMAGHGVSGPAFVRPVRLAGFADEGVLRETKRRG